MPQGAAPETTPKAAKDVGCNDKSKPGQAQQAKSPSKSGAKAAKQRKTPAKSKVPKKGKDKTPPQAAAARPEPAQKPASSFSPQMPISTPATEQITCFGHPDGPRPKKHLTAVDNLYLRRVWIGYSAPDKINDSFRGLPSYAQLQRYSEDFSGPFPPFLEGIPAGERQAACKGCAGENPETLTIQEKVFNAGRKLAILPLEGPKKEEVFAILIPQPTDRSMAKVQIFHLWEWPSNDGKSFRFKVGVLAVRNTSHAEGTLATILKELNNPQPVSPVAAVNFDDPPSTTVMATCGSSRQSESQPTNSVPNLPAADKPNQASKRKRSDDRAEMEQAPKRHAGPVDAATDAPTPTPCLPTVSPAAQSSGTDVAAGASGNGPVGGPYALTDEQAGQITFIWAVQVADTAYESVHTLREFEERSGAGLLSLLSEDAAVDDEMLAIVLKTKMWRLSFAAPGGGRKAYILKPGSEAAFERLKEVLAGVLGSSGAGEKVVVEVEALAV